jgi:hypothetical protein
MTYPPGEPPQPYQPQPYQQPYPPCPPTPPTRSTNGFAVASLILGLIGFVWIFALLSVIFGIIALNQTKGGKQQGRGMAITGLVLSGLWTVILVAVVVVLIMSGDGSVRATDVQVGDCIETTPAEGVTVKRMPKVSCDKPHQGEVYALLSVSGETFPGQTTLRDQYQEKCVTALDTYSSKAAADSAYQIFVLYPTQQTWDQRDRRVACLTITDDKRTGSVKE